MNNPIEDLISEWIDLEREMWTISELSLNADDCRRYRAQANTINKCRVQLQEVVKKMEAEKI